MKEKRRRMPSSHPFSIWALILGVILFMCNIWGCGPSYVYDDVDNMQVMRSNYQGEQPGTEYILQSGDELEIKFYYTPEFNTKTVIRPDGIISLQLIGDVKAGGMTPSKVQQIIRDEYAKVVREPAVTVIVTNFSQKVYVGGEVANPQMVNFESGKTALQAIFAAGGFKESAEMRSVLILRKIGQPDFRVIKVDLMKLFLSKKLVKNDLQLQPSDVVFVPKTLISKVDQFVDQYMNKIVPSQVFTDLIRGK
ncbi:MAG: polysaccharide biosynthesis/export family protein [bacterium]